jgi:hypothetical protein
LGAGCMFPHPSWNKNNTTHGDCYYRLQCPYHYSRPVQYSHIISPPKEFELLSATIWNIDSSARRKAVIILFSEVSKTFTVSRNSMRPII